MAEDKRSDFRVIDKRGIDKSEEVSQKSGEGFVMKDGVKSESKPPAQAHELDFSTLVFSFATSAMINLGITPDPATNRTEKNLDVAKQNIDILNILKEKTKGNLTTDEAGLIENLLTEMRLRFVEASKK